MELHIPNNPAIGPASEIVKIVESVLGFRSLFLFQVEHMTN